MSDLKSNYTFMHNSSCCYLIFSKDVDEFFTGQRTFATEYSKAVKEASNVSGNLTLFVYSSLHGFFQCFLLRFIALAPDLFFSLHDYL